jgi:hypothetical protein
MLHGPSDPGRRFSGLWAITQKSLTMWRIIQTNIDRFNAAAENRNQSDDASTGTTRARRAGGAKRDCLAAYDEKETKAY